VICLFLLFFHCARAFVTWRIIKLGVGLLTYLSLDPICQCNFILRVVAYIATMIMHRMSLSLLT